MEVCSGCSCDSVQVFNGYSQYSSTLGKFCTGRWKMSSSGSHLFVKFTSDASGSGRGFTASYYRVKGKDNFRLSKPGNMIVAAEYDESYFLLENMFDIVCLCEKR